MPKPTSEMATFESEKLRSRKSPSGSSGSAGLKRCHTTNATSTATPVMMRPQTVIGPTIVPQS